MSRSEETEGLLQGGAGGGAGGGRAAAGEGEQLHEGFLHKTDPALSRWQKRYFVLDDQCLSYYNGRPSPEQAPKKTLSLATAQGVVTCEPPRIKGTFGSSSSPSRVGFQLMIPGRNFYFACDSEEDRDVWVTALRTAIHGSRATASKAAGAAAEAAAEEASAPQGDPNLLRVAVLGAEGLLAADSNGLSDPFAVVSLANGIKGKTKTIKKTLDPTWMQGFEFDVTDGKEVVTVAVYDHDTLSNDFLGQCQVPLMDLQTQERTNKWLTLKGKKAKDKKEGERGRIRLVLHWVHSIEVASRKPQKKARRMNMEGEMVEDTETAEELPVVEEVSPEELLKEKEEQEEKEKEKQKRLEGIEIKKGDYQVHVHVIEVRDLKSEDLEGTSDPVVHVSVFGETQHTKVMKKTVSCVFDDVFFFKAAEMTPDRLETETIKVSVFDADTFSRNDLIGSFQFDAVDVYYREHHELHEQWVGLTDEKSASDNGIQGYLKLSICVLGPGDKKKVHSESEKKSSGDLKDISGMVMMPPAVKQEVHFLVVTVLRAEGLPIMDSGLIGSSGIDAFVRLDFGGNPPLKTRTVTCKGKDYLNPVFNEEMWLPVTVPTMSNSIALSVWDKETIAADELVAHAYFNFAQVQRASTITDIKGTLVRSKKLSRSQVKSLHEALEDALHEQARYGDTYTTTTRRWVNLYGAPVSSGINLPSKVPSLDIPKHRERMNKFPDQGTTFKGRVLVCMRVSRNPGGTEPELVHKKSVPFSRANVVPRTRRYTMLAYVIRGSDIPVFHSKVHIGHASKMAVRVSIGGYEKHTGRATNAGGIVDWNTLLRMDSMELPADPRDLPDIFVHLLFGKESNARCICSYRISATEFFKRCYPLAYERGVVRVEPPDLEKLLEETNELRSAAARRGSALRKGAKAGVKKLFGGKKKKEQEAQGTGAGEAGAGAEDAAGDDQGEEGEEGKEEALDYVSKRASVSSRRPSGLLRRAKEHARQVGAERVAAKDEAASQLQEAAGEMVSRVRTEATGGFSDGPQWVELEADPVVDALRCTEYPGSVLLRLGFGPTDQVPNVDWVQEVESKLARTYPCSVRVRVYQARNLPAADSNGMSDPFVVVRCYGQSKRTSWKPATCDPRWYETLEFDADLPEDLHYCPEVIFQVLDHDTFGSDDILGSARIPMRKAFALPGGAWGSPSCRAAKLSDPQWVDVRVQGSEKAEGQLLASIEVTRKRSLAQALPPAPSIVPEKRSAYLEVVALGLRDLKTKGMVPLTAPFAMFDMGERGKKSAQHKTAPSKRPEPRNPNFLERIFMPVELPVNPLFTPRLNLRVFDSKLGGFSKRLLAQASVPLETKVPWSKHYVPPCSQRFPESGDHVDKAVEAEGTPDAEKPAAGEEMDAGGQAPPTIEDHVDSGFDADDGGASLTTTASGGDGDGAEGAPGSQQPGAGDGAGRSPRRSTVEAAMGEVDNAARGRSVPRRESSPAMSSLSKGGTAASSATATTLSAGKTLSASASSLAKSARRSLVGRTQRRASTRDSIRGDKTGGSGAAAQASSALPAVREGEEEEEEAEEAEEGGQGKGRAGSSSSSAWGGDDSSKPFGPKYAEDGTDLAAGAAVMDSDEEEDELVSGQLSSELDSLMERGDEDEQLEALGVTPQARRKSREQQALQKQLQKDSLRRERDEDEAMAAFKESREDRASTARTSASQRSSHSFRSRRSQRDVASRTRRGEKQRGIRKRRPSQRQGEDEVDRLERSRGMDAVGVGGAEVDEEEDRSVANLDGRATELESRGTRVTAPMADLAEESSEDEDDVPEWMVDREQFEAELEDVLETQPFETYPVFRGQSQGNTSLFGKPKSTYREVGRFKGIIRVVEDRNAKPLFDVDEVLRPRQYTVRVYVLEGHSLMAMDANGKSDPFIKLKLGKTTINDQKNYLKATIDPLFYRCFELQATLPGPSQLRMETWDYDMISSNDLIGATTVDLEDRVFDQRWRAMGSAQRTETRLEPKPVERRALWQPTSTNPQGLVDMWVDVLNEDDSHKYPAIDISLPPPQQYEVRVIVWKTKDVVSGDVLTDQNDMFVRGWLEGCKVQETDIHWRAKKGKGSFNWRFKWDVELPFKFPYLHFQLWDKDILKWDDCIAETAVDLSPAFELALRSGQGVNIFSKKDAKKRAKAKQARKEERRRKREAKKKEAEAGADRAATGGAGKDSADAGDAGADQTQAGAPAAGGKGTGADEGDVILDLAGNAVSSEDEGEGEGGDARLLGHSSKDSASVDEAGAAAGAAASAGEAKEEAEGDGAASTGAAAVAPAPDASKGAAGEPAAAESKGDAPDGLESASAAPAGDAAPPAGAGKQDAGKKGKKINPEAKEEASGFAAQVLDMMGMGPKPEDADWLVMTKKDWETGETLEQGQLLVTVEVLPKEAADAKSAGKGRSEPNQNPRLPPPTGRIKLTAMWNPIYVLNELLGPKICGRLTILILVAGIVAAAVFLSPFSASILQIFDYAIRFFSIFPTPLDFLIPIGLVLLVGGIITACCLKFKGVCFPCMRFLFRCFCPCCTCCQRSEVDVYYDDEEEGEQDKEPDEETGLLAGSGQDGH